jgi:hypothetical protein
VTGITEINDIATCSVTGNVYVSGRADDIITVIVFNHLLQFIRIIETHIKSTGYFPYISETRTGEMVITHGGGTVIAIELWT